MFFTLDHTGPPPYVLSWSKSGLKAKVVDPWTFGCFEKRGQIDKQDSCFISIDITKLHNWMYE